MYKISVYLLSTSIYIIQHCDFFSFHFKDSMANGIAVDHISRLLFYTDTLKETITLMTLDGLHEKVVINSGLDQPRAIELDPING